MDTHRIHLHHVGIPSVETNANIVIAIVALGSCTIDMTILGRSNKSVHCVRLLCSQQQNVNESKKRDYYLVVEDEGIQVLFSGGNWTSAIYLVSVRFEQALSFYPLNHSVWFRFMYLILFVAKIKGFNLEPTWYETYAFITNTFHMMGSFQSHHHLLATALDPSCWN